VYDGSTAPTSSQQIGRVGFAPTGRLPVVSQDRVEAAHRARFETLRIASGGEASIRSLTGEDCGGRTSQALFWRQANMGTAPVNSLPSSHIGNTSSMQESRNARGVMVQEQQDRRSSDEIRRSGQLHRESQSRDWNQLPALLNRLGQHGDLAQRQQALVYQTQVGELILDCWRGGWEAGREKAYVVFERAERDYLKDSIAGEDFNAISECIATLSMGRATGLTEYRPAADSV
jgi:hypothetical protein